MKKKELIKARLRALFPKANLSSKRLDAIADKLSNLAEENADETAIDALLNEMNKFTSFEDIAKEDDRIRTLEAKANPPADPPTPPVPPTPPTPTPDDVPSWAKAILETNKKLSEDLETLKTGKLIETKKATALDVLNKSEVLKGLNPEIKQNWLSRFDLNSETPFDDQLKGLEDEYNSIVQNVTEQYGFSGPPPTNGSSVIKPSDEEIKKIVDNMI